MQGVKFKLELPPACTLIVQPPADTIIGDAAMFHYTWGSIWSKNGTKIWSFDKRFYTDANLELQVRRLPRALQAQRSRCAAPGAAQKLYADGAVRVDLALRQTHSGASLFQQRLGVVSYNDDDHGDY